MLKTKHSHIRPIYGNKLTKKMIAIRSGNKRHLTWLVFNTRLMEKVLSDAIANEKRLRTKLFYFEQQVYSSFF